MFRLMAVLALAAALSFDSVAHAQQVRVRVPFVDVDVGPGVRVRAPFVNLWIPFRERLIVPAPPPPPPVENTAAPPSEKIPAPIKTVKGALTTQEFVKNFNPREGVHEVNLMNPVTKAGTKVRFTLPAGVPERVICNEQRIEFVYGPRRFVRIEFDHEGAIVTTR